MIGTGAMSDPYMHCEEELKLTRRCLEIILENNFGLAIQTKSDLILRDIETYGNAYVLPSPNTKELTAVFKRICRDNGIMCTPDVCFRFMQELPEKYQQMSIFDV